jgi:hypothetical protein
LIKKLDRSRITTVFPADPDFQIMFDSSPLIDRQANQATYTLMIKFNKRIGGDNFILQVKRNKLAFCIITAITEGNLN